jgi:hypothetical protein
MRRRTLCLTLLLAACGDGGTPPPEPRNPLDAVPADGPGNPLDTLPAPEPPAPPARDPLATPESSIERQLALLLAGDFERLRACFTARLRDRITKEMAEAARKEMGKMSLAQIAARFEPQGDAVEVIMEGGRTLTTLVRDGDRWLADTIWFR